MASAIARTSGKANKVGQRWIYAFFNRHPEVAARKTRRIDQKRDNASTVENITAWFEILKAWFLLYCFITCDIWNMDETGVMLGASGNNKVVGATGGTSIGSKRPGNRD